MQGRGKEAAARTTTTTRYRSNAAGEPETETKIQSQKCKQREQGKADGRETGRAMRDRVKSAQSSMLLFLLLPPASTRVS